MAEKRNGSKRTAGGGKKLTKKEQEERKRRSEARKRSVVNDNPAKAIKGIDSKKSGKNGRKNSKKGKNNKISWTIGVILAVIQLIVSAVFMIGVFMLDMLPVKYLAIVAVILLIALLIAFASQLLSKKKGIAGKIFSVFMSVILGIGSFYIFKTNGTISEISGGSTKVDSMVVAVLADDAAESISDASGYNFGVQYALNGEDVEATVSAINEELGSEITTTEYSTLQEQATALQDGSVQAIIYNQAYDSVLDESIESFSDNIKVIYTYDIESEVESDAADIDVENNTFTVYISGIDVYGEITTNSRSDVNILAVVNTSTHQILLVTTPRDSYVEIPGISGGTKDKLTHAGIYGVDASMATLEQLYSTEIDFYARVNFTSLVTMVDALGGIDVESEQAFTTSEDSGLVMNVVQGTNHFTGVQALAFSRERQNVDGGDFQRGKNQQAVITAMIKKAISPAILMGASGILDSVSGNVDTNMTSDQIQTLIKTQLADGASWSVASMAAEGTGDYQYCYSMPSTELYVTQLDATSIATISAAINSVENGELLADSEEITE